MEIMPCRIKISAITILIFVQSMLLSACIGSVPTDIPEEEDESFIAETVQALSTEIYAKLTPEPTLIPVSPSPSLPTTTAHPAATRSLPNAARILFAPGATYGVARGTIEPDEFQTYAVNAQQGQPMMVSVASTDNDVTIGISTESGTTLLPASQGWSNWQGTLSASQDYYIKVIAGASDADYSLWVSIPSRIEFEPGETVATVSGQTVDGNIASYVIEALDGQSMDIVLTPERNVTALTVWGFNDGQPYVRAQMGSTKFNMVLPATQDYIIDVVPHGSQEVDFTLRVEIQ